MRIRRLSSYTLVGRRAARVALAAAALTCLSLTGVELWRSRAHADPDVPPGPARSLDDLTRRLEGSTAALAARFRPLAKRLADTELATLRDLHVTNIGAHQEDLLVRTVEFMAGRAGPLPEEVEFQCAWLRLPVERLVRDAGTDAGTAQIRSQLADLKTRLGSAAEQALGGPADTFRARYLDPGFSDLDQVAQSLAGGGPMHPLPAGGVANLVAEFGRKAAEPSPVPGDPTYHLGSALSAVYGDLLKLSTGVDPGAFAPSVQKALDAWMKAERRRSDEARRADEAKFEALVVRDTLGPEVEAMVPSAAVADALGLWHELRELGAQAARRGDPSLAAAVSATVRVVFWRDGKAACTVEGPIVWSPVAREGSTVSFADQDAHDASPVQWWDGMGVRLTATVSAFALQGQSAEEEAGCGALPPQTPPFTHIDNSTLLSALAAEATVARSLWSAVLGLLRGGSDTRIKLAAVYSQGLAPVMWNSQPRAVSAVRQGESVILQTADGRTVARITGGGWAAVSTGPKVPLTMEVELSPREVTAARTGLTQTIEGNKPETETATIAFDAHTISVRLHATKSGALLLDEYKAVRADASPLCTVSFRGYSADSR